MEAILEIDGAMQICAVVQQIDHHRIHLFQGDQRFFDIKRNGARSECLHLLYMKLRRTGDNRGIYIVMALERLAPVLVEIRHRQTVMIAVRDGALQRTRQARVCADDQAIRPERLQIAHMTHADVAQSEYQRLHRISRSATKCSPYAVKPSSSSRAEQPQDGSGILAEYHAQRAIHGCARSHVTDSSIQDASPHVPNSVSQIGTACPCANASSRMRAKYCGND